MSSALDFLNGLSVQSIMQEMLDASPDTVDKREGSVIYDAIADVAVELSDLYNVKIPTMYAAFDIMSAVGGDLDKWANDFGLERLGAEKAIYAIDIQPAQNDLAENELLTSHNTNERWVYIGDNKVESLEGGDFVETRGQELEPDVEHREIESIVFAGEVYHGRAEESDEELRERIVRRMTDRTGGSVQNYVDITLEHFYGCLVFPCGRRCGKVQIRPIYKDWVLEHSPDDGEISTCSRWAGLRDAEALKEIIDPINDEGYGYGLAPIGHRVEVVGDGLKAERDLSGGDWYTHGFAYNDMEFKINVVYDDVTALEREGDAYKVPDDTKVAVFNATMAYINKIIDNAVFRKDNTPQRRGNRYRMLYVSSEHAAALDNIKSRIDPNIIAFQISYRYRAPQFRDNPDSQEGWSPWMDQSDDIISSVMTHLSCRMFRLHPRYEHKHIGESEIFGINFIGKARDEDAGELDW